MQKATSTSIDSPSSALANVLVSAIGFNSLISETSVKPSIRKKFAKAFTDRIRKEAGTPDLWGSRASLLQVSIGDDDRVTVGVEGSEDEIAAAQALEYGSPGSPPRGVMRTYEADFNEEYKVAMSEYSL